MKILKIILKVLVFAVVYLAAFIAVNYFIFNEPPLITSGKIITSILIASFLVYIVGREDWNPQKNKSA